MPPMTVTVTEEPQVIEPVTRSAPVCRRERLEPLPLAFQSALLPMSLSLLRRRRAEQLTSRVRYRPHPVDAVRPKVVGGGPTGGWVVGGETVGAGGVVGGGNGNQSQLR